MWKFVFRASRGHRKMMLLGFVLTMITLLAAVALLATAGWFISASAFAGLALASSFGFDYFLPAASVRMFAMARIASRYGERIVNHDATFRILSSLRVWLYRKLEPKSIAQLLNFRSADLLNRMLSDIDALTNVFLRITLPVAAAIAMLLLLTLFLWFISPNVAIVVLVAFLVSMMVLLIMARILGEKPGKELVGVRANLRVHTVDCAKGLADLLMSGQWLKYRGLVEQGHAKLIAVQRKMAHIQGLTAALYTVLLGGTLLLVSIFAIHDVDLHRMGGALIALCIFAVMGAFEAIMPLPRAFQYLSETHRASARLTELTDDQHNMCFAEATAQQPQESSIALRQVSFDYGAQKIFDQLDLQINSGEKLGIVGPTGSGKSTLLHLMARTMDPQAGQLTLGAVAIEQLAEADLRQHITMITQRVHIFNGTLRENLLIANPEATDAELIAALEQIQLGGYLAQLTDGLDTWLGEAGAKVSGGQARRIALARAILHNAPIWLLDEPTEGLDSKTEADLLKVLAELIKDKTVVMVSHREAPLQLVDRILPIQKLVSMH